MLRHFRSVLFVGLLVCIGFAFPSPPARLHADAPSPDYTAYLPLMQTRPALSAEYRALLLSNRAGPMQLYTLRADGSDLLRLSELIARDPAWSPDGATVLFATPTDAGDELYVVQSDGANLRPLATLPGHEFDARWSPDGGSVLTLHTPPAGAPTELYTIALNDPAPRLIASNPTLRDAHWSPDGSHIAYTADAFPDDPATLQHQVYLYDTHSGATVQLTGGGNGYLFQGWLAGGKQLLISSDLPDERLDLYTIEVNSGDIHPFASSYGAETVYAISLDGQQVVYSVAGQDSDGARLYSLTLGDDTPLPLSDPFCLNAVCGLDSVAFSPDSARIAYVTWQAPSANYNLTHLWFASALEETPVWRKSLSQVFHPLWLSNRQLIVHRNPEDYSVHARTPYLFDSRTGAEIPLLTPDDSCTTVYEVRYMP